MKTILLALLLFPLTALADTAVCYGVLDGGCQAPALSVAPANHLTAPADIEVLADGHSPVTLFVTVTADLEAAPIVPEGVSIIASDAHGFVVSGAPPFVVTLPTLDGRHLLGGDDITASYRLTAPNEGALLLEGQFTVAHVLARTEKRIPFFNPAGNPNQQSLLRLSNLGDAAPVTLIGIDDHGSRSIPVTLTLAANASLQLTGDDLERGNTAKGLIGSFGTGTGKWQVLIVSPGQIEAMGLMRNGATGPITNLSQSVP